MSRGDFFAAFSRPAKTAAGKGRFLLRAAEKSGASGTGRDAGAFCRFSGMTAPNEPATRGRRARPAIFWLPRPASPIQDAPRQPETASRPFPLYPAHPASLAGSSCAQGALVLLSAAAGPLASSAPEQLFPATPGCKNAHFCLRNPHAPYQGRKPLPATPQALAPSRAPLVDASAAPAAGRPRLPVLATLPELSRPYRQSRSVPASSPPLCLQVHPPFPSPGQPQRPPRRPRSAVPRPPHPGPAASACYP